MPDWGELRAYARENLKLLSDEPRAMVLGWQQPREGSEPSRQAVYLYEMTAYAEPWLVLVAPVCPEELIPPRDALQLSNRLTLGALVVRDADYALRTTFSLQSLPLPDVVLCIERLAWVAVALREHYMDGKPLHSGKSAADGSAESTEPPVLHGLWAD